MLVWWIRTVFGQILMSIIYIFKKTEITVVPRYTSEQKLFKNVSVKLN